MMTIGVHSHFWRFSEDFSAYFIRQAQHLSAGLNLLAGYLSFAASSLVRAGQTLSFCVWARTRW